MFILIYYPLKQHILVPTNCKPQNTTVGHLNSHLAHTCILFFKYTPFIMDVDHSEHAPDMVIDLTVTLKLDFGRMHLKHIQIRNTATNLTR